MNDAEMKLALAEVAPTAGLVNGGRSAFAEFVVETIQPNHLSLDLFSTFLPTVQYKVGEMPMRRVRKGRYPVRQMVPGTKHLTDIVFNQEKYAFMFDRLIVGTSANVWEIRSGDIGTIEQMQNDMKADLFDKLVANVFNVLSTAWNGTDTPNNYLDATGSGITETALETMIENMTERNGGVRAIIGTRQALMPIYKFAQVHEFQLSGTGTDAFGVVTPAFLEFLNTRTVSKYTNIPLIEIPQIYANQLPDLRAPMIDADKIILVSDTAGQIALQGGFETQDYTDPTTQPANYVLHGWQSWGLMIDNIEGIGVIEV